jgi:hypothetical protein
MVETQRKFGETGGIYSLERISKESPDDYWTVMEILTAFVRDAHVEAKPAALRKTPRSGG